jgi:histidinol-phosphate aminotransferase
MSKPEARPGLAELIPYVGGESDIEGKTKIIKLASNEGALGPSPKAVEAYKAAAETMYRYPDGECIGLRKALADFHGIKFENIVCGAGTDEIFGLLCHAYVGPGDQTIQGAHAFLMYAIQTKAFGGTPIAVPEKNLNVDVDAMLDAVTDATKVVFVANPNNPTGTYVKADELYRLREALRDDILLVIDSAYAEYINADDYTAGIDLVEAGDNVVMTRTFSKIYAMGGMRLGFAYCPHGVAYILNRVRHAFNVTSAAQVAGIAALHDQAFVRRSREHNRQWLAWTMQQIRGLGLEVPDSAGNFVLIRFPNAPGKDAEAADKFLKRNGIIVRRMGVYGLPDYLRVSIGLEHEMRKVADVLGEFVGKS